MCGWSAVTPGWRCVVVISWSIAARTGGGWGRRRRWGASATLSRSLDSLVLTPVVSSSRAASLVGVGSSARVARLVGLPSLSIDARGAALPALVWEVRTAGVQGEGTPSRLVSVVDAVTGAL